MKNREWVWASDMISKSIMAAFGTLVIPLFAVTNLSTYIKMGGVWPQTFLILILVVVWPAWAWVTARQLGKAFLERPRNGG